MSASIVFHRDSRLQTHAKSSTTRVVQWHCQQNVLEFRRMAMRRFGSLTGCSRETLRHRPGLERILVFSFDRAFLVVFFFRGFVLNFKDLFFLRNSTWFTWATLEMRNLTVSPTVAFFSLSTISAWDSFAVDSPLISKSRSPPCKCPRATPCGFTVPM